MTSGLEQLWADLLSEKPPRVIGALLGLSPEEREAALAHLRTMAHEPGWSEGQARRARSALAIAARDPRLTCLPSEG